MPRALAVLAAVLALALTTTACRSLPEPGPEELAPHGADDPDEFEGELEEGGIYSAELRFDEATSEWSTVIRLQVEANQTARIDWVDLTDFPALTRPRRPRARVVFEVISRDARPDPEQPRSTVSWACRILSAEAV